MSDKENEHVGAGRRHKATDEQIIRTAWELFEAKGYEATTMADIAEAVGIARRSLFNYFSTKESLLFPFFQEQMEVFRNELLARPTDENFLESFKACIPSLDPIMAHCDATFVPGAEVARARNSASATRYSREIWAAEMEDAALARLGSAPDAHTQAGFVGALVGQAVTELANLALRNPELPKDQALIRVISALHRIIG